jgi:hypothetical protein
MSPTLPAIRDWRARRAPTRVFAVTEVSWWCRCSVTMRRSGRSR